MSIGLALSGGGAKGATHIGVLQALKEENITIDYISGTSSGSIVATLFALGYEPYEILKMFNLYCNGIADYDKMLPFKLAGTFFTGKLTVKGLAKGDKLESLIQKFCAQKNVINIDQVKMPLAIPTVDLYTGEVVYYLSKQIDEEKIEINSRYNYDDIPTYKYSGKLSSIVRASSSFPCLFEPKALNRRVLIDGGVRVNTPVSILKKMGADNVIAVAFDKNDHCTKYCTNIISVAMKAFDLMEHQVNFAELEEADYLLRPNIEKVGLLDFSKTSILAREGYKATKKAIKNMKFLNSNDNNELLN